jgi:hypothetical protein
MKLLTYPLGVQSVGGGQQESVASGAGWDLAYMVSRLQRKSNPLPPPQTHADPPPQTRVGPLVLHLRRDVIVPRRARGAKVVSGYAPSPPLPL